MKNFADRLREIREEYKMTQLDVAKAIGTTKQTVSRWETNFCEPDLETVLKLAQLFKVSIDYLFGLINYEDLS